VRLPGYSRLARGALTTGEISGMAVATPRLLQPVADGSAWTRDQIQANRSWVYQVELAVGAELEDAIGAASSARHRRADLSAAEVPLPSAGELVSAVLEQLEHGRGMALMRGVPVQGRDIGDCELLYEVLAAHLGTSIVQDTEGTLTDHVADRGLSYDQISVRGYTTNAQLTPHCDSGDIVALLCIHPAKSGGVNTLSSSLAVYNEILRFHPDLLEPLYRGFYYNIRGNGPPGPYHDITSHRVPVYSFHRGRLSCRFNQKAILTAEQLPGGPTLTEIEKRAVNTVAELSMDSRFSVDIPLAPGDLLLLCNHTVFHNRSSFEDGEEPHEKRLLLRKWINVAEGRELTLDFGDHYNTGIRQGPYVPARSDQLSSPNR
jgi:hypothetical protein